MIWLDSVFFVIELANFFWISLHLDDRVVQMLVADYGSHFSVPKMWLETTVVPNHITFSIIWSIYFCLSGTPDGCTAHFGIDSRDDVMPGRSNQSLEINLMFLIHRLSHINQILCDLCKAPVECGDSDSCLAYLPTPGPSAVPVSWLAVPRRSKKWDGESCQLAHCYRLLQGSPDSYLSCLWSSVCLLAVGVGGGVQIGGRGCREVDRMTSLESCFGT